MSSNDETQILGFQFEPETKEPRKVTYADSAEDEDSQVVGRLHLEVNSWCNCGNCRIMPSEVECICCSEIDALTYFNLKEGECITKHEDFEAIVLRKNALWTALVALHDRESRGLADRNNVSNKSYRYAAYRQFSWFAHSRLGKGVRRVIPSCVVCKIREVYPSKDGAYIGYREIEDCWCGNPESDREEEDIEKEEEDIDSDEMDDFLCQ